jgi:fructose-bisphosphate aldolase class II
MDQKAAIAGSIAGAKHVHEMAKAYGVPVILHTDHCAKKLLPWIDGLLKLVKLITLKQENLYLAHI